MLAGRRRVLGAEHPDTLTAMNNLAVTTHARGDLAGARALLDQVVEPNRRLLGAEHPSTLIAMNNLAQTVHAQGDLAGARKLQEQVLEARRRLLGPEHPDTLTTMNDVAETMKAQGDLAGTEAAGAGAGGQTAAAGAGVLWHVGCRMDPVSNPAWQRRSEECARDCGELPFRLHRRIRRHCPRVNIRFLACSAICSAPVAIGSLPDGRVGSAHRRAHAMS